MQQWWPNGATILRDPVGEAAAEAVRTGGHRPRHGTSPGVHPTDCCRWELLLLTRVCCCRSKSRFFSDLNPPATAPAFFCCCWLPSRGLCKVGAPPTMDAIVMVVSRHMPWVG